MNQIPYAESNGELSVEVELQYASDVFLIDSLNFQKYKSGYDFEYFGGHFTETPVHIHVSGKGRWYLIVIGGGQYKYRFY